MSEEERRNHTAAEPARDLAGKVAVITGAASGQGRATALRLAEAGAAIGALDVDAEGVAATARAVEATGGTCLALPADVASEAEVAAALEHVRRTLGDAYVLAAAAAIYPAPQPLLEQSNDDVARIFAVNVLGVVSCVREAARQMVASGAGGRIVLWSSVGAQMAIAGHAAYCGSKSALEGMARAFAAELGPHGILVNTIVPGAIETPMIAGVDTAAQASVLPVRRIGQPEDVAELAAFLSSPRLGFVTGTTFHIDGGLSAINGLVAATGVNGRQ